MRCTCNFFPSFGMDIVLQIIWVRRIGGIACTLSAYLALFRLLSVIKYNHLNNYLVFIDTGSQTVAVVVSVILNRVLVTFASTD